MDCEGVATSGKAEPSIGKAIRCGAVAEQCPEKICFAMERRRTAPT
ncbi:MAG: hypothetical protein IJW16_02085 [Clostridia bacterium]|nr:hypothetical protein [Clostridia bacterium]